MDIDDDDSMDIDIDDYTFNNLNMQKGFQVQHVKDNKFKFVYMGMFENLPSVPLGDFKVDDDTHCYLTSNFVFEKDIYEYDIFPQITLVLNKNNNFFKLLLCIKFENPIDLDKENIGDVTIIFSDEQRASAEIIKKKLIYPGSEKIIYFLVNELKNDKIKTYINEHGKK